MHPLATILGVSLVLTVGLDAFQTIILPRRPTGRLRLTRLFYILTWHPWSALTCHIPNLKTREQAYSIYGPLSLLLLLVLWAILLIAGFALVYFALGTPFKDQMMTPFAAMRHEIFTDLYVSGTTLFTLGLGDVVPVTPIARAVIIFESGVGLGLVALVMGYLPVLYTAFSKREIAVALLDARAGSPPTAAELLSRHGFEGGELALTELLAEWERWAAELLESHVSYPILCYYRSQHDNQSWLAGLLTVLDACALLITTTQGSSAHALPARQAQLTFAMARHALVDLGHIFHLEEDVKAYAAAGPLSGSQPGAPAGLPTTPPNGGKTPTDRLPPASFRRLCTALLDTEIHLCGDDHAAARLHQLRQMYEPNAQALAAYLGLTLPHWIADPRDKDPWHRVASLRSGRLAPVLETIHVSNHSTAALPHEDPFDH